MATDKSKRKKGKTARKKTVAPSSDDDAIDEPLSTKKKRPKKSKKTAAPSSDDDADDEPPASKKKRPKKSKKTAAPSSDDDAADEPPATKKKQPKKSKKTAAPSSDDDATDEPPAPKKKQPKKSKKTAAPSSDDDATDEPPAAKRKRPQKSRAKRKGKKRKGSKKRPDPAKTETRVESEDAAASDRLPGADESVDGDAHSSALPFEAPRSAPLDAPLGAPLDKDFEPADEPEADAPDSTQAAEDDIDSFEVLDDDDEQGLDVSAALASIERLAAKASDESAGAQSADEADPEAVEPEPAELGAVHSRPEERDRLIAQALAHAEAQDARYRQRTGPDQTGRWKGLLATIVFLIAGYIGAAPPTWVRGDDPLTITESDQLRGVGFSLLLQAREVETFRALNQRLPESLAELNAQLPGVSFVRSGRRAYQLFGFTPAGRRVVYDPMTVDVDFGSLEAELASMLEGS